MKPTFMVFVLALVLSVSFHFSRLAAQCTDFYGMTSRGGEYDNGTIFLTDGSGENFETLYSFPLKYEGKYPAVNLCATPGGKYFGLTRGTYGGGAVLFEWDTSGNTYTSKYKFILDPGGQIQYIGPLIPADNGKLYGIVVYSIEYFGYLLPKTAIYEFDPSTNQYTEKYYFDEGSNGLSPYKSLVKANDGKLYGMTGEGGDNSSGVLFEWDPVTDQYTKRFDFNGEETGYRPASSLIQATNGNLFGMTLSGGANGGGVLFEWDPVSGNYCKRHDFTGYLLYGTLLQADDGKIYGTKGNAFFEWDAVADTFYQKVILTDTQQGDTPSGALCQAPNGKLYGLTTRGGTENLGVLFEWDPSTDMYTKKLDFNGRENGGNPAGSLVLTGENKLVGVTEKGGTYDYGVLFEWDIDAETYVKKFDFNEAENGSLPMGSFVSLNDGKLYSTTSTGGKYNYGVLFEWDIQGRTFTKKADFTGEENGKTPVGTMIRADNDKFIGVTKSGGANDQGVIFSWDPVTGELSDQHDFMDEDYSVIPVGTLLKADNGKIYGMTSMGGGSYNGVLFELDSSGGGYTKRVNFEDWTLYSDVPLIQDRDGKIYGIAQRYDYVDIIFEWDPGADTVIERAEFTPDPSNSFPSGSLIQADNGNFYAELVHVGCGLECTYIKMMEWDPVLDTVLYGEEILGDGAHGSPIQAENGKIYGMSNREGDYDLGMIFECDPVTLAMVTKHSFTLTEGRYPFGSLFEEKHTSHNILSIEACGSYTSPAGKIWMETGVYTDTILSSSGCDSIITVNLTVYHPDTNVTQEEGVLTSTATDATWQWIDCDNGNSLIEGETGQSFTAQKNGHYAVIVTQSECTDTSACFMVELTGGTSGMLNQGITVFPNPNDGSFSIDLGAVCYHVNLTLAGPDGRIITKAGYANTTIIDLKIDAPAGIYFLTVIWEGGSKVLKIVKQ